MRYFFLIYVFLLFFACSQESKTGNITELESTADRAYTNNQDLTCIELYSKLIALDSAKGLYYFRRGVSYTDLKNYRPGIEDYLKCIQLNAITAKLYFDLGLAYNHIGKPDSSLYYIENSYKLDSTNEKNKFVLKMLKMDMKLKEQDKNYKQAATP